MNTVSLGFIGMGIMGRGMASNLLKKGYPLTIWNRDSSKGSDVEAAGAYRASSLQELSEKSDVVFICVTDGTAVEQVLFSETGISSASKTPGLIIDCSTIAPSEAKSIADRLSPSTEYLDAPVSGGDTGAKNGTLSIMVGGKREVFEEAKELFSAVGKTITYTGGSGSGQKTKCVNQMMVALTVTAMTEGLAYAARAGLDLQTTLDVVSAGAAGSWSLENYAPRLLKGDRAPSFFAADMLKDLKIALEEASNQKIALPGTALCAELYTALLSNGETELGNHALISLYERMTDSVLLKK